MFKDYKREITNMMQTAKIDAERTKDIYSVGFYNGLEYALSCIEKRETNFMIIDTEIEVREMEEQEQEKKRTVYSGVIK